MMRIMETKVYKFEELSDEAKEKAREWWRARGNEAFDTEWVFDDAAQCGEILGIDLCTGTAKLMNGETRPKVVIYYSGFWSQGDGACFEGNYSYAKGSAKKIRQHAPNDKELHRIADALQEAQRKVFYTATAITKHRGHYYHSGCMDVSVNALTDEYCKPPADVEETITQCMRDFADWIYDQLREDYEWRMEDEQVDDNIICNEYEFTEDGKIA
jgi:hypothetical protein